jgi:hypothetical protein
MWIFLNFNKYINYNYSFLKLKTMKKILLSCAAMAALIFSSCSENGKEGPIDGELGAGATAYFSIKIDNQSRGGLRASGELAGSAAENEIQTLYLFTFKEGAAGGLVNIPNATGSGSSPYTVIEPATTTLPHVIAPFKVSADAKRLLVIANPGTKLLAAIENLAAGSLPEDLYKSAITAAQTGEIRGTFGFTMINKGTEDGTNSITSPLFNISAAVIPVSETMTEDQAKAAAEIARVTVGIERLASKLLLKTTTPIAAPTRPGAAGTDAFAFSNWTIDNVNTTFFPFAVKDMLSVTHNQAADYASNFYTHDPNFDTEVGTGLISNRVDATTLQPNFFWENYYGWKTKSSATETTADNEIAYVIENTMAATSQKFGNATRVVIKGVYTPNGFTEGADWFAYANTFYKDIETVVAAYKAVIEDTPTGTAFTRACDGFLAVIRTKDAGLPANFADLTNTIFNNSAALTALAGTGGELVKYGNQPATQGVPPTNPVLRWFDNGVCHYYYEVRHDNETDVQNAFGKYGMVRNNWYNLTLRSVTGPGTPWYPDVQFPGGDDPKPEDDIDKSTGYVAVTVEVAKWIFWDNIMDL